MFWQYFRAIWIVGVVAMIRPAEAWFEECDNNLTVNYFIVFDVVQPNSPARYPSGSSCRYTLTAPMDYQVQVTCRINMDKGANGYDTENFYIHTEGHTQLESSERFSGVETMVRRSMFRKLTLSYTSSSTTRAGSFTCSVQAIKQPCQCGWSTSPRIVGGQEAQRNEFPFIAALVYMPTQSIICSATIITHKNALTTASCFSNYNNPSQLALLVGEHNIATGAENPYTVLHLIESIKRHERFEASTNANDIALLRTKTDIEWSRGVGPACLLSLRQLQLFPIGQVEIAGWGTTFFGGPRSTVLMKGKTTVIANVNCRTSIPNLDFASQMCINSAPQGPCQFDTGGALMLRFTRLYAVGLISYGQGCGTSVPTVSTRISPYLDWIMMNIVGSLCPTL